MITSEFPLARLLPKLFLAKTRNWYFVFGFNVEAVALFPVRLSPTKNHLPTVVSLYSSMYPVTSQSSLSAGAFQDTFTENIPMSETSGGFGALGPVERQFDITYYYI